MKAFFTILVFLGLLVFVEGVASACICKPLGELTQEQLRKKHTEEVDWANVIFSGEVLSVDTFNVKFRVDKVWKGKQQDEITMSSGAKRTVNRRYSKTSCDYEFKVGEKYVVYARMKEGDLQTHFCSGTSLQKNAEAKIKFLGELQQKEN